MCGLFGACGPGLSAKDREAVKTLGELTKVRGKDSTGIFTCYRPTSGKTGAFKVKTYKKLVESPAFLASKAVKDLMADEPFVIGGHCRFATHGKVNLSNAHPFSVGHFVLEHNGVISDLFDRVNDKTDSLVLTENMMKLGVVEGIKSGLSGDMALIFINKSNGSLNYYRNDGRPLFIGIEEKKKKFFWASQKDFLEFIQKNGLAKFSQIYMVQPNLLHTVDLKNMQVSMTEIKAPPRQTYSFMDHWQSSPVPVGIKPGSSRTLSSLCYQRSMTSCASKEVSSAVVLGPLEKPNVRKPTTEVTADENQTFFRGFSGELWDVMAAAQVVIGKDCGCTCCGEKPKSMAEKIWFLSRKEYLCDRCRSDEALIELCYDDVPLWMGCLVDKNNIPRIKVIRDEEERAIQEALPF